MNENRTAVSVARDVFARIQEFRIWYATARGWAPNTDLSSVRRDLRMQEGATRQEAEDRARVEARVDRLQADLAEMTRQRDAAVKQREWGEKFCAQHHVAKDGRPLR